MHSIHRYGTELNEPDYAALARCGIPREMAAMALLRRVDTVEGHEIVGRNGSSGDYGGVIFPYLWPGEDRVREYRLRRDQPDLEQGADGKVKEKAKYVSPPGRGNLLYVPPQVRPEWLTDVSLPLIITEGEKKTLALWHLAWYGLGDAADKPRWLPVGLSGVWNWRGKVAKQDGPHGERQVIKGPIPDLARIESTKREDVILFDANVYSNANVRIARACLAAELRKRGAHVLVASIPPELGLNGIDDVIGQLGPDKALEIIASAYDPKKDEKTRQSTSFVDEPLEDWQKNLLLDSNKQILQRVENFRVCLSESPAWKGAIQFDEFRNRIVITDAGPVGIPRGFLSDHTEPVFVAGVTVISSLQARK